MIFLAAVLLWVAILFSTLCEYVTTKMYIMEQNTVWCVAGLTSNTRYSDILKIPRSAHTAAFMCFVWFSEQTAMISLYSIN